MTGDDIICCDCLRTSTTWYWNDVNGKSLTKPRCPNCHAKAVMRVTRRDDYSRGMVIGPGPKGKFVTRRGTYGAAMKKMEGDDDI